MTNTPTPTVTSTPLPATVRVSLGSANPPNSIQLPGASNVPVLQVQLTDQSASPATITTLTLTASGTGNSNTGISQVAIYIDTTGNGVVGTGTILLGTGVYVNGALTLTLNEPLPSLATVTLLVVDQFSANAPTGTYQTGVAANSSITGTTGGSNLPIIVTGAPATGSVVTIAQPTATTTATITSTLTPAPTSTPVDGYNFYVSKNVFNPNNQSVSIYVTFPPNPSNNNNFSLKVYNSAGEFIKQLNQQGQSPPTIDSYNWDGTNMYGDKVADGIYILYLIEPFAAREAKVLLLR
jgi:hypothetical protein